ncbi:hypothetical protein IDJ75_00370 [Mucilaginibacter rigui]|uniref:Uncharacterized protein n=1 Tax=Mucilaginibacter rigui TaxID=534635 RepID=A0ABR7X2A2_9SPHI|nr:hypothetical protein [Mucilaginibacter rigui]MBD1383715.1 hypothetical protein [Mucilaginibacter rigui]
MKVILLVIAALLVIIIFKACVSTNKSAKDISRPSLDKIPTVEKPNDKLIIVQNVEHFQIKTALTEFCNSYNKDDFAALPRLYQLSPDSFAIIFPFDTDLSIFCFATNFLKYPIDIKWQADVHAWATIKKGDDYATDYLVNKPTMIYLDKADKEYDNVFLTTKDGDGYKVPFAKNQPQALSIPIEQYKSPTIKLEDLKTLKYEDFK